MSESLRCPKCGIPLLADAPAGLCPKCLVQAGFESQPVSAPAEPRPTKSTPPVSGFVPPTVEELALLFPQLEILELLGKGGMGAVYKARQPGLDRLVAVKILPPEISRDPAFAERFQREARALARLSHPHIVAVYDFGVVGSGIRENSVAASEFSRIPLQAGLCYIVMEFIDGANLRQTIRTGKLAAAEALAIVPQICEALQFAHDEGIVHRDIKPENILIDKRGRVKIADFGLAKLLGTGASDHSLTATHQVMGTLRYMAPEQMQSSREVDHRADIYSLGVVFYELLTGELPMGRFAPPSKRVQVDVRLDEIVLRALEQDPEQRYQHASEVKTAVEVVSGSLSFKEAAASESQKLRGGVAGATGNDPVRLPRNGLWAVVEREMHSVWRWVGGDTASPTQPLVFPGRFMILLSLAGCLMLMVPWLDLHIDQDANVKQFWSNAELPSSFSRTLHGSERWPGIVTGAAFGLLTLLLIMTPRRSLTWNRAAVMSVIAAGAVLHPFLFKPEDEKGNFTIPIVRHEDARLAGLSGATSGDIHVVGEPRMERVMSRASVPLKSIEHQVTYREGFYGSLALAVVLLVFSGIGVRRAAEQSDGKEMDADDELGAASKSLLRIRRQLKGPGIALMLYGLIIVFPAVLCFTNGFDIADGNDASPTAVGFGLMALSFLLLGLAGLIIRGGWHMLAMENYRAALLASFLGQPIGLWGLFVLSQPDVKTAFASASRRQVETLSRPKLVPVFATMNLVGAIGLMLFCAMEQPPAFVQPVLPVWQVWEKVDSVLGFAIAAGMFAASIGLFLWKPWARKLTLGVSVFGLASFVFDVPYLARFGLPDVHAEIQQTMTAEGMEPEAADFMAMLSIVLVLGGVVVVGVAWLIGQLVYFTRPRVVAAFESQGEKHGKFIEWLFTGTGAVVGVLSVFAPLALLLGLAAFFKAGDGEKTVDPAAGRADSKTGEVWIGNKGAEIVMFLGPDSPTVSDRLASHLSLDSAQRAAMDQALGKFVIEFRALEAQHTQAKTDENGHQITTIAPPPKQLAQLAERFWSQLESVLDGRQLTLGRRVVHLNAGMFAVGDYGYRIEIWRVGQINPWYHWRELDPGLADYHADKVKPSSGPELPEKLRRFWKEPEIADAANLQGTWVAVTGERNGGQPLSANEAAGVKVTFDRDQFRVMMQGRNYEGTFKLDVSQRPKRIAVTRVEGPNRFGIMDGIYELDGEHLRVCMGEPEERATEFKTKAGSRLLALDLVPQTAVGPIAFESVTGQLAQTGTLVIERLGKFDVIYPCPFAGAPTFIFPREQFTGPGRFAVQHSTPTGFTIDVSDAAFTPTQPVRIGWLATGVPATDDARILGTWNFVSMLVDGQATGPEELKGWKMTYAAGISTGQLGDYYEKGSYKLDPTKTPKTIDVVVTEGRNKGHAIAGIYEWDGDNLKFCWAPWGSSEHPKEFSSTPGSGHDLVVLKREKPASGN